jgi:regulatory protein
MRSNGPRRPRPPLSQQQLDDLALRYVGRYATSRARLCTYLGRKIRERGWSGEREPDIEALADRLARLGYVDDAAYALSKSRALTGRGYGKRRLTEKLRHAGIGEEDGAAARAHADAEALAAALRFAERRRLGPFATVAADPASREKAMAALARAGHSFALARAIADLPPGAEIDMDALRDRARLTPN